MLRAGPWTIITLVVVVLLCTCIDPYSPKLKGYESLLVVDGLITDKDTLYTIRLSRTIQNQNAALQMVTDATISITDNAGNNSVLTNKGKGIYQTNSPEFKGIAGRTYVLHVHTGDGEDYESDPCLMEPVPEIDSLYFEKDQELVNNSTEKQDGITIYLDSKAADFNKYFRWEYDETWRFKVPTPKKFNYINDSTIVMIPDVKEYCWKSRKSDEVLIQSVYQDAASGIKKEPICFIAADKSDRLLLKYSILVRQYSISKQEYDFWDNMKMINESGGDIFAKQPFSVSSNLHNLTNTKERVLGYFQVSAVRERRKYIILNDIADLGLPFYIYPCKRIEMAPKDYPISRYSVPLTWDDLYNMYCVTSDYYFVEPKYIPGTTRLDKMVFAKPECANCELTGTSVKPAFWVD
jgi:hypothetical protein